MAHAPQHAETSMPILLWPGLAANEQLFAPILERLPTAQVPAWIKPSRGEPLSSYAERYAQQIELPEGPFALGGFSFGGQFACELATHLARPPAGIVLICGVRTREQFTRAFHFQQRLGAMIPATVARRLYVPIAKRFAKTDGLDKQATGALLEMAAAIDPAFLNWSGAACADWSGMPDLGGIPIRHVHGQHDRVIPDTRSHADHTIKDARHLITLTHPAEVADFVSQALNDFAP